MGAGDDRGGNATPPASPACRRGDAALGSAVASAGAGDRAGGELAVGSLRTEEGTARLGAQPRNELLDLPLARVSSRVEESPMVLGSQVDREEAHRRESDRALREPFENDRELSSGPGRFDTPVGGVLGEVEDLGTVREQRRAAFSF